MDPDLFPVFPREEIPGRRIWVESFRLRRGVNLHHQDLPLVPADCRSMQC